MGDTKGAFSRMRCKICGSRDVEVFLRSYGLRLCRDDFIKFFEKRVERAIGKFKMFTKEDNVLVAVSGGKDSLALLYVLSELGYNVSGYFLDLGIGEFSEKARKAILNFAEKFSIPIKIESLKEAFGYDLLEISKVMRRPPCSFCGIIKRYFMNKAAESYILATGHTLYDEAAVLLSNIIHWRLSYLARQGAVLPQELGFSKKVKPLIFLSERETAIYCFFKGIDYFMESCPLSKGATSRVYKHHLLSIEADMPGSIIRFLKGFYSAKASLNFPDESKKDMVPCRNCGYATTAEGLCAVCRIRQRLENYKH